MQLFKNLLYIFARIIISVLLIIFGLDTILPGIISGNNVGVSPMSQGVSGILDFPIGFLFLITGIQMLIGMRARAMAAILALILGTNFFLFDSSSIQQVALFGTLLLFVANGSGKYSLVRSTPLLSGDKTNELGDENEIRI
jgi:uncharacterized membrane protein YphA (DoxX/SURF4 family)